MEAVKQDVGTLCYASSSQGDHRDGGRRAVWDRAVPASAELKATGRS